MYENKTKSKNTSPRENNADENPQSERLPTPKGPSAYRYPATWHATYAKSIRNVMCVRGNAARSLKGPKIIFFQRKGYISLSARQRRLQDYYFFKS